MSNSDIKDILASIEAAKKAAYQEGWDAAIASIKNEISNSTQFTDILKTAKISHKKGAPTGYRPGTTIAKVHQLIKDNPGLTGVKIFQVLKQDDIDIEERTVRTSLHRLRDKWGGLIENHNGFWYEKGAYVHDIV